MSSKPILYSYWRSSAAARVRIAFNLKNVEYEYRVVNLLDPNAMNDPDFVSVNPARKVPALVVDGQPLTESLAIIEYIDEKYPGVSILPKDPIKRAQARAIALQISAGIHPIQNLRVQKYINSKTPGEGPNWALYWLTDGLRDLEKLVTKTAGKYTVGDDISIGDLCLPSILYNARRYKVDLSEFPVLTRIDAELAKHPAFIKAAPENQPDANLNA